MCGDMIFPRVKAALRVTEDDYNDEIRSLINSALIDLGIAGVEVPERIDAVVETAVITYCRLHFLFMAGDEYGRLKAAYDEQKAQLVTATGYTRWST